MTGQFDGRPQPTATLEPNASPCPAQPTIARPQSLLAARREQRVHRVVPCSRR